MNLKDHLEAQSKKKRIMGGETNGNTQVKPPGTIVPLRLIGNFLLGLSIEIGGAFLVTSYDKDVWHFQSFIAGIATALSGVISLVLFYGLASIIEQLFEIRQNTSTEK